MSWARGPRRGAPDMGRAASSGASSGGFGVARRDPRPVARGSSRRVPCARGLRRRAGLPEAPGEVPAPGSVAVDCGAAVDRAPVDDGTRAPRGDGPLAHVRADVSATAGVAVRAEAARPGSDGARPEASPGPGAAARADTEDGGPDDVRPDFTPGPGGDGRMAEEAREAGRATPAADVDEPGDPSVRCSG